MTTTTLTPLTAARRLIARAEQRAARCGGKAHEYISEAMYQELKAAVERKPQSVNRKTKGANDGLQ
jgi:hypothetical protein